MYCSFIVITIQWKIMKEKILNEKVLSWDCVIIDDLGQSPWAKPN